jgi:monoamine oxidase
MKSLEKVIFTYEERFWDEGLHQIALLSAQAGFLWVHDVSSHSGVPTLVGFYNPMIADTPVSEDDAVLVFGGLLRSMFGSVPDPLAVATTSWGGDQWSMGGYSFIPVGGSADDMNALGKPGGSRVLFAGEHTYPEYYGTVQAAWLSGRRAARHILAG